MLAISDYQASPDLICSLYSSSVQLDSIAFCWPRSRKRFFLLLASIKVLNSVMLFPFFAVANLNDSKQKQPHGVVLPVKWQMGSNV